MLRIVRVYQRLKSKCQYGLFLMMSLLSSQLFAGPSNVNPFPSIGVPKGKSILEAIGNQMESGMRYAMIGGGIIMMLVGIGGKRRINPMVALNRFLNSKAASLHNHPRFCSAAPA
jgi:hypothetical protein